MVNIGGSNIQIGDRVYLSGEAGSSQAWQRNHKYDGAVAINLNGHEVVREYFYKGDWDDYLRACIDVWSRFNNIYTITDKDVSYLVCLS